MKRILVTGSNGFLGQKITARFLNGRDFDLIATGIGPDRYPGAGSYTYLELDLTDEAATRRLLESSAPHVVINTAAMALPDRCEEDPESCDRLNRIAVAHLAAACRDLGIQIIQLSTDFIFDGKDGPYREHDTPRPISVYGRTKLAAEEAVQASGAMWAIIRTVLVYGVAPGSGRSNIVLWVKSSLEKGQPIRVVSDQWRSPTLADDLADACIRVALNGAEGIFHVSGAEQLSVYELAQRVAAFWQLDGSLITPVKTAELNENAQRPKITGFYIDKAIAELQFQPRTLEEGFAYVDRQLTENF